MKPKDIFNLAVRLLGLLFLYHALQAFPLAVGQMRDSLPQNLGNGLSSTGSFTAFVVGIFMVGWPLLVAIWLLCGASIIVRLAYPDKPDNTEGR